MQFGATVKAGFIRALVLAFGRGARMSCAHDDETGYTVMSGKIVHCKCGESFKVKCMHISVQQLLPRVFQCVDCGEVRGMGRNAGIGGQ